MRNSRLKENDIFNPSSDIKSLDPDRDFGRDLDVVYVNYTLRGFHDTVDEDGHPILAESDNEDLVFAREVRRVSNSKTYSTRYYVKVNSFNRIYNPIGITDENTHSKLRSRIGDKEWKFKEVNHKCFDNYIKFLATKNLAYHRNAEREII